VDASRGHFLRKKKDGVQNQRSVRKNIHVCSYTYFMFERLMHTQQDREEL